MAGAIVRNSFLSAIAGAATSLGGFLSMVLVARMLGVQETGAVAYAIWIASMTVTFLDFGVHPTLARYLPELLASQGESRADQLTAALFRPYLCACALFVGGLCVYGGLLSRSGSGNATAQVVFLVAALGSLQVLGNFASGQLRGTKRFGTSASLMILSFALQVAGVAVGGYFYGYTGVLLGYCAGATPLAVRSMRWLVARTATPRSVEPRMIRFAAFAWAGALAAAFVWSRSEVFFLQRSWGDSAVGLLSVGLTLSNIAAQGPMLLTGALLAFFSERIDTQPRSVINNAFAAGTRILAFLTFPLCLGTAAILPALLPLLYGHSFDAAIEPSVIVVIAAAIAATGAIGTHMMLAHDRSDFIFYSNLAGATLSIIAGVTIIPAFGVVGAAWGRAAIQVFMVGLGCWFITRRLRCPIPFGHLGRLLASGALCAGAARLVLDLMHGGPAALPFAIGAGVLVYGGSVRSLRALPSDDIARLRAIGVRWPPALRWFSDGALRLLMRNPRAIGIGD